MLILSYFTYYIIWLSTILLNWWYDFFMWVEEIEEHFFAIFASESKVNIFVYKKTFSQWFFCALSTPSLNNILCINIIFERCGSFNFHKSLLWCYLRLLWIEKRKRNLISFLISISDPKISTENFPPFSFSCLISSSSRRRLLSCNKDENCWITLEIM